MGGHEGAGASECARRRECVYGESVRGVACAVHVCGKAKGGMLCAVAGTRWRCVGTRRLLLWDRGCVLMIWGKVQYCTPIYALGLWPSRNRREREEMRDGVCAVPRARRALRHTQSMYMTSI